MEAIRDLYQYIADNGVLTAPRGVPTLELAPVMWTFPPYCRFANFRARKLSLDYIKREWQWYVKGDRRDLSICEEAKIWSDCVTNGMLYSNYGYYWFRREPTVFTTIKQLAADPDTRQAVITVHSTPDHNFINNKDRPCQMYTAFQVRNELLDMHVHMRSQDAIYGLGNDLPAFSFLQEMVARALDRPMGHLTLMVDSLHVYERHFDMLEEIASGSLYEPVTVPTMSALDTNSLFEADTPFRRWLYDS